MIPFALPQNRMLALSLLCICLSLPVHRTQAQAQAQAQEYLASFRDTDISEFINTVSQNLNKTIIIDPAVKGQISVKSYEKLTSDEYYQFFLSVLEVYGFAVVHGDKNVLKVVPSRNASGVTTPMLTKKNGGGADQLVSQLVSLKYQSAKEIAPLLKPVTEATGGSSIIPVSGNVLLITGRARVVERMTEIISSVDVSEDNDVDRIKLGNASAKELVDTLSKLINAGKNNTTTTRNVQVAADERTNTLLIAGDSNGRREISSLARSLDEKRSENAGSRVIFLQHAKAENILEVLTGMGTGGGKSSGDTPASTVSVTTMSDVIIKADAWTNALIIKAPQKEMDDLDAVITRLDIRRPQVLVEAIMVEIQDSEGLAFGVQWFNKNAGGVSYPGTGNPVGSLAPGAVGSALADATGLATGFYRGNWSGLFTALQKSNQSNILATPSIVTLDNKEAEFTVGQEVPVLTGTQSNQGGETLYNTVERKNVGIKLKVRPQISKGDTVMLEIEQEVSSVVEQASTDNLGPKFDTRFVKNTVLVNSGNTVVVGGLLDNSNSDSRSAVPLLGNIPVLGHLFRSDDTKKSKRNLMLFIRPTVIRDNEGYTDLTENRTERFRQNVPEQTTSQKALNSLNSELHQPDAKSYTFRMVKRDIEAFYRGRG